jgi:hypothetical protein
VVKARSHVPQTCLFLQPGAEVAETDVVLVCCEEGDSGGEEVEELESGRYWAPVNCEW